VIISTDLGRVPDRHRPDAVEAAAEKGDTAIVVVSGLAVFDSLRDGIDVVDCIV
jgi:hypothetical protein